VLPLDTVISCILIWRIHKKLCADFPDEYAAYCKEKKQTATPQTKLQAVAVILYWFMMLFSAFRIFTTSEPLIFWASVILFLILFVGFIVLLCFHSRQLTKELSTCIQNDTDHG
jgi:protein-S-isoprenylcysteine O-methyltransferase Ste14